MEKKIKMYFVCSGTSTNDIISSINNITKKNIKKSFFSFLSEKKKNSIEKDTFPQLESIGIKEMFMCKENEINKRLIEEITEIPKSNVFTSLEYSSIESALILVNERDYTINVLPYMSENSNLKKKEDFNYFKNQFGIPTSIENITDSTHYWDKRSILSDFISLKKESSRVSSLKINWNEVNVRDISTLYRYDFYKFISILEKICKEKYKSRSDINSETDNYLFICNAILLEDILGKFRGPNKIKYNKKIDIIERSSIWEINITINFSFEGSKVKTSKILYDNFRKIYPVLYNYEPLIKTQNTSNLSLIYSYKFNDSRFILFNALKDIPRKYIEIMTLSILRKNKINLIRNIIKNIKKENNKYNKKENLKENLKRENNKVISFETLKNRN